MTLIVERLDYGVRIRTDEGVNSMDVLLTPGTMHLTWLAVQAAGHRIRSAIEKEGQRGSKDEEAEAEAVGRLEQVQEAGPDCV
jgi:hypothetical protein